jgi:hypothetical protein
MLMFPTVLGAWVLLAAAAPPELNDQTFAKWRDHIRPKPAEVSWEEVPWRATLWDAVVEAQEREKPILLWAMNGHPLACT